jgi:hypothetical protein
MGFLDNFKKSFDDESQRLDELRKNSSYRTVKQREADFNDQSDSALLGKINGMFTSDEDKEIIAVILRKRGYVKTPNGAWRRP